MHPFPRTVVSGISLPRMLIGSNWVLGYSHTGPAADAMIRQRFSEREAVTALIEAYLTYDINAMMAPFAGKDVLLDGIHEAEDRTGKKVILIDTPILDNVGQRAGAEQRPEGDRGRPQTGKRLLPDPPFVR